MSVKRWLVFFVALVLMLVQVAAFSEGENVYDGADSTEEAFSDFEDGKNEEPAQVMTQLPPPQAPAAAPARPKNMRELHVANTTPMSGDFSTDLWGDATSDMDVRNLLHGYNLIRWDGEQGIYLPDESVISGFAATEDDDGNHVYIIALYEDLKYSDGTPITAWDYAFSMLLSMSREVGELGATPKDMSYLLGYKEYMEGTRNYLSGVNVLSDYQMLITINHEFLPYFYEMGLLSCVPYPISVIAPGVKVTDAGMGVYLANQDGSDEDLLFTAELLETTMLDPDTGYLTHPSVVSGPYVLDSFDGETASFSRNTFYKGNYKGIIPAIEKITFTAGNNDSLISQLSDGTLDVVNKVTQASLIREGMAKMVDNIAMSNYPRQGLAYVSFNTERPIVSSLKVRQALASCMDKDALVSNYVGYYGLRVDGFYGIGQWMYTMLNGRGATYVTPPADNATDEERAAYEDAINQWNSLNLDKITIYTLDVEKAKSLLISDGWTLNEDGSEYVEIAQDASEADKDAAAVRYKEIDGQLVPLELTMVYPRGNAMAYSMEDNWVPYLRQAGISLIMKPVSMGELMMDYHQMPDQTGSADARDCDMVYLATNFNMVYDPLDAFIADAEGNYTWNYTNLVDSRLYNLAQEVSKTDNGDTLGYATKWVDYQARFTEVLPAIPIYSNVYFDFYTTDLENYNISDTTSWSEAVLNASFKEEEPVAEATVTTAQPALIQPTMMPPQSDAAVPAAADPATGLEPTSIE